MMTRRKRQLILAACCVGVLCLIASVRLFLLPAIERERTSRVQEKLAYRVGVIVGQIARLSDSGTLGNMLPGLSEAADREKRSWRYEWLQSLESEMTVTSRDGNMMFGLDPDAEEGEEDAQVRLMAVIGDGSAYQGIIKSNWKSVCRTAPDAVLVIEVTNADITWRQPGDLDPALIPHEIHPPGLGVGANLPELGFLVGFVDGTVWGLSERTPYDRLAKFFTVESAAKSDRERLLRKFVLFELPTQMAPCAE